MKISMKNQAGFIKQTKVGFSWTTLFFGFFVPLIRGDWKWFAIMLLVCLLTCWVACVVFAFIYNKQYIKGLFEAGWVPADPISESILVSKGMISSANYL